jgi:hypothetical protein
MNQTQLLNKLPKISMAACYISPAVMVTADITTVAINHTVNPLQQTISGYAVGPYGWLEKMGMVLVAVCFALIATNIFRLKSTKELRQVRFVGDLLVIVAIGFLMLSIFNTNVIGTIISFHGFVHQFASAAVSIVFYLACLLVMRLMLNQDSFRYYSFYSGLTFLVGLIVTILLAFAYRQNNYIGLLERLIAGFNLVWIVVVGPQVIRLAQTLQ